MKNNHSWLLSTLFALALCGCLGALNLVAAQGNRAPNCTAGAASGTYGYRMAGQIVGVGPFLVNGLFTHYPDGTMDADVTVVVGAQSISGLGTEGSWTINSDCTGKGKFKVPALGSNVTYNFIATDGGDQIDLLNTDPGIVLHGYGRRIAKAGKAPSCNNGTILGTYGYRLDGSLPNLPAVIVAGIYTHRVDDQYKGLGSGNDTFNLVGQQYLPRINNGTYTLDANCRGKGVYSDSLGSTINYVFTVVDGGDKIFFMGTDPGTAVSGEGRRIK